MNTTTKTAVETTDKEQVKPVLRKVEARRWDKAIAPNHNNHNHTTATGSKIVWG